MLEAEVGLTSLGFTPQESPDFSPGRRSKECVLQLSQNLHHGLFCSVAMLRAWKREGEQKKLDALSWIIEHEAVDTLLRFVKELNEKRATNSH